MSTDGEYVGIVLVSHSAAIADGLRALLRQFADERVPIVAAGGTADGDLGTDGGRIADAILRAAGSSGAVVLMDMGSAVLSVRHALDEVGDVRVSMADAPLVEGGVAAAVAASSGAALAAVTEAAEEARMSASSEQAAEAVAVVPAGVALHARPAGVVSREAMGFASTITLIAGERQADAKSVLRVMALGADGGTTVVIRAEGEDATAAAARIAELIDQLA